MKLRLIAVPVLALLMSPVFASAKLLSRSVGKPHSKTATLLAATACFPSCLEDLKAACAPAGSCTKNEPAVQTDTSVSDYCFMNGVKIASSAYSEARTKPDGSICYSVDTTVDVTGTKYQYAWKNAGGTVVATESLDYADMNGRYHSVTCGGTTTVVDTSTPDCVAEQMQQLPDISVCVANSACTLAASTGAGGAGGAPGAGGAGGAAGGKGGTAPATGGASGQGGAPGAGGAGGAPACPAGQIMCGAGCTDLMIDKLNCGLCANACASGYTCMQGACAAVNPCNKSTEHVCNGSCVDFETDSKNCGGCGATCPDGTFCSATPDVATGLPVYTCASSCAAGTFMCGGDCKPIRDERNCGACDTACGPTSICCSTALLGTLCADKATSTGPVSCQPCPSGLTACNGICVPLSGDASNCGQCGVACQFGCSEGKCISNPANDNTGSCAVGTVSGHGTWYGLAGVGLALTGLLARRRRR